MPTNLPPNALEAERRYREARSPAEKIRCLEEFIGLIPKHKGTDKIRANLRKRLSKLKDGAQGRKGVGKRESAFSIDKEGAGQAVLVGPANTGKSALLAALTNATPQVSAASFSTWKPVPGMMQVKKVQIQLIDTPSLGRGIVEPELVSLIRRTDIILLVVDLQADPIQQIEDTLSVLQEHRIAPLRLKDRYPEQDRLTFVPFLVLVNKNDDESLDEDFEILCELLQDENDDVGECPLLPISVTSGRNLESLKQDVFDLLGIIRIYSKAPGKKKPDYDSPFVLRKGGTVAEFAAKVHQDFIKQLKSARVWGSATHDGQMVRRDHVLHDGDVVELRI